MDISHRQHDEVNVYGFQLSICLPQQSCVTDVMKTRKEDCTNIFDCKEFECEGFEILLVKATHSGVLMLQTM